MKATKKKKITKKTLDGKKLITIVTVVVAIIVVVYAIAQYLVLTNVSANVNAERKERIVEIYYSFKLGSEYKLTNSNIFGEKRVYEYDAGRTYSSSQTYERDANVDVTVADLKKLIEAAGFHYFAEPYPGSASTQLHFLSVYNEYVRLTVSSKPRDDAFKTTLRSNKPLSEADFALDPNNGPSNVLIKVNLDDNNE